VTNYLASPKLMFA